MPLILEFLQPIPHNGIYLIGKSAETLSRFTVDGQRLGSALLKKFNPFLFASASAISALFMSTMRGLSLTISSRSGFRLEIGILASIISATPSISGKLGHETAGFGHMAGNHRMETGSLMILHPPRSSGKGGNSLSENISCVNGANLGGRLSLETER